jgi:2-methylcitrate dehydratase PrpD
MGLAASVQLGGTQYVLSGGHEKDLCPGHESRRALLSTLVAEKRILGSTDILEGERGIFKTIGAQPQVIPELGREYRITECYIKPYPACRYLHASIEAALNLVREHGISASEVEKAIVTTNTSSARRVSYEIKSHVNAIFSHAYQVAAVLRYGRVDLPITWEEKISDPLFNTLLPRVEVRADPEYDRLYQQRSLDQPPWPAEVEVFMQDGRRYQSKVLSPKGDPGHPMTPEEVKKKFIKFTEGTLSKVRATEVIGLVDKLETVPTVDKLIELLVVK